MTLQLGPNFTLPDQAVTETFGILAVKRAGKSNAAVVIAEEMFAAGLPWVAIDPKGDWWGVRSSGDGKGPGLPVLVFGGEHGDVPLEPGSGNLVADLVASEHITCILDVSEMSKADQRRFLRDFATRLYRANREPLHVFCEEADEYIPQRVMGEMAALVGAFETLVKRGGFRGIGITLITQRSASLNKDVLTQIGTLFALRTTSPQDRKAILGWVEQHASGSEAVNELPGLESGEAFVYSPSWLQVLERMHFRQRQTFDSGATPEIGKSRRQPVTVADIDLAAIKEAMNDTIERAKADDPKQLRARIAELEKALVTARKATPEPVVERIEVPILTGDERERFLDGLRSVTQCVDELQERLRQPGDQPKHLAKQAATVAAPVSAPKQLEPVPPDGNSQLGKGERKVLSVLAQYPDGRTHNQLAFLAGYSAKASTLGVILSNLRRAGLVEPQAPPRLTVDGMAMADPKQLPTGEALLEHWLAHERMGEGERRVLGALVDNYPEDYSNEEICSVTGYSPSASTIGVILSKLRKLGLVEKGARRLDPDFAEAVGR